MAAYQNGSPSWLRSSITNNSCPFLLAKCKAELPFLSTRLTCAPLLTSNRMVDAWPSLAHICNGVWPLASYQKQLNIINTNHCRPLCRVMHSTRISEIYNMIWKTIPKTSDTFLLLKQNGVAVQSKQIKEYQGRIVGTKRKQRTSLMAQNKALTSLALSSR